LGFSLFTGEGFIATLQVQELSGIVHVALHCTTALYIFITLRPVFTACDPGGSSLVQQSCHLTCSDDRVWAWHPAVC